MKALDLDYPYSFQETDNQDTKGLKDLWRTDSWKANSGKASGDLADLWETDPESKKPVCPFWLTLINIYTGEVSSFSKKCNRWLCPDCAPKRARIAVETIEKIFREEKTVYFASMYKNLGTKARNALRDALNRYGFSYMVIGFRIPDELCGWVERYYFFANGLVNSKYFPRNARVIEWQAAVEKAEEALISEAIPTGEHKISGTWLEKEREDNPAGEEKKDKQSPQHKTMVSSFDALEKARMILRQMVKTRYGIDLEDKPGSLWFKYPESIPLPDWVGCISRSMKQAKIECGEIDSRF